MRKAKSFDAKFILDHLTYGVLVFDGSGRLVRLNAAAEEMLEISERQALGESVASLFHSQGHRIEKGFQRAINEAATFTEHNVVIETQTGHSVTINVSASPMFLQRGDPCAVLIELIKVDRFLRISKEEQLLAQNSVATNLIRGLAHEIKNPLGGLRGAAQLLAKDNDAPRTRRPFYIGRAPRVAPGSVLRRPATRDFCRTQRRDRQRCKKTTQKCL